MADFDFDELLVRYLDDALTPEEQTQLNEHLRTDPQMRQRLVSASLQAVLIKEVAAERRTERPSRRRWVAAAVVALAAAAIVLVARRDDAPVVAEMDRVAIVSSVDGAVWKVGSLHLGKGQVLGRGKIDLVSGKVRLDFFSGAKVVLEGPVEVDLQSPRAAFVRRGVVNARVHNQAIGFTLSSPGAKVFDLGTEFTLNAAPSGTSDVRVFRGEVEASVLGADGMTLENRLVTEGEGAVIDPGRRAIADTQSSHGARIEVEPPAPLRITPAYVERVRAGEPIAYWRFENVQGGFIENELGREHPLRVVGDVTITGGPENRFAAFSPELRERFFTSDDFRGLASRELTVEMWVNAESIRQASLASLVLVPRPDEVQWSHLVLLELRALENQYSHPPGAVRFLHRWPPGPRGGVNIFSSEVYRPGTWHHLVGVRQREAMSLYMDGRLIRRLPLTENGDDARDMRLVLGILPNTNKDGMRNFVGWMDEVAIYARALTAEEIAARYQMVQQ